MGGSSSLPGGSAFLCLLSAATFPTVSNGIDSASDAASDSVGPCLNGDAICAGLRYTDLQELPFAYFYDTTLDLRVNGRYRFLIDRNPLLLDKSPRLGFR